MENKRGSTTLIVVAAILVVLVIVLMIVYFSLGNSNNQKNSSQNTSSNVNTNTSKTETETKSNTTSTTNTEEKKDTTTTTETKTNTEKTDTATTETTKTDEKKTEEKTDTKKIEDESGEEEVKKIDNAQGKFFEKEISIGNGRTVKIPVINLTTKAATRINSEIEKKYQDEYKNGNYVVYYYYMYIGMISIILDHRNASGNHLLYELYNVNTETGKQMTNEDLLTKLKVSKDNFLKSAEKAYKAQFEEVFKTVDKNSNEYKKGLEATMKNAQDAINGPLFINLEAEFAIYAKIPNVGSNGETYYFLEFK